MAYEHLNDFIDAFAPLKDELQRMHNTALIVMPKRYGPDRFFAFLAMGEPMETQAVAFNFAEDTGYEQFMKDCDWFPFGMGVTIDEALAMLDARCAKVPRDFEGFQAWWRKCDPIWHFFKNPQYRSAEVQRLRSHVLEPR